MSADQCGSEITEPLPPSLERVVGERIDASMMGGVQLCILILCMLLACFDGYDIASMGLVVPLVAREWHVSPGSFGGALAVAMVGSATGSICLGWLGDRVGRRPMVIISAVGVGLTSLGAIWAGNVTELVAWRFLIGIAFGAGLPNVYALVGDTAPSRHRTFCTTLLAASTSLGAMAGGLIAPILSSWLGWKGIFLFGGVAPMLIALLMIFLLRESPRVLAARARIGELVKALADFGLDNTNLPESRAGPKTHGGGPLRLVRDGLLPISLFYLLGYITCGFAFYMLANWLPALLSNTGWSSTSAQRSIAFLYGGSLVGGLSLSWIMDRLPRGGLLVPAMVFACGAVLFVAAGYWLTSAFVFLLLGALGLAIGGGQYILPALAVRLFPPSLSATALSWFFPLSRVGGISGSLVGGWMLISGWRVSRIMTVLGLAPLLSAIFFAALYVAATRRQQVQIK